MEAVMLVREAEEVSIEQAAIDEICWDTDRHGEAARRRSKELQEQEAAARAAKYEGGGG